MTVSYLLSAYEKNSINTYTVDKEKTVTNSHAEHRSGIMRLPPVDEMALGRVVGIDAAFNKC